MHYGLLDLLQHTLRQLALVGKSTNLHILIRSPLQKANRAETATEKTACQPAPPRVQ
jgi:hypothetical protein